MEPLNITTAPKTATFQMRINPEIKARIEELYARQGLTMTDAVNLFLQQSLNINGLPFLVSPENAGQLKAKAMQRLLDEVQQGWDSVDADGWIPEEEAYHQLGATP